MALGLVLGFLLVASAAAQATEVLYCVPYDQPDSYAERCTEVLARANTEDVTFKCVPGGSSSACMDMMQRATAHLTTFDGGDVIEANAQMGAIPLLFENYGYGVGASYYAVAAVKKEFCDDTTTLESLRGAKACHTGYRKTAGWVTPVGTLLSKGIMERVSADASVEDDAESVAGFFSSVCAPRTAGNGPQNGVDGKGVKWDPLCTHCGNDCTTQDSYYDYPGAFRCMMEGAGDVAFIKHSTIPDYALGGPKAEDWGVAPAEDFMLLCSDGGCMPPSEYEACNLARVPAHAVIAPASFGVGKLNEDLGRKIQDALTAAAGQEGFLDEANELLEQPNFIFKSSTVGLDAVTTSFEEAVGPEFLAASGAIEALMDDAGK